MLTNFIRAKLSTHGLLIAVGVLAYFANRFFSDPQAAAWLHSHWVARDLYGSAGATLIAYGIYSTPTKPMV